MHMTVLYFALILSVVNSITGKNMSPDKVYANITGTACISFKFDFDLFGLISVQNENNITILTAGRKNGDPTAVDISDDYTSRLHYNGNLNENRVSFCLRNVTINDSGIYRLQKAGLSKYTVTLFILNSPVVRLVPNYNPYYVIEGSTFNALIDANPENVTVTCESGSIQINGRTLSIPSVTQEDRGYHNCNVSNTNGLPVQISFYLNVQFGANIVTPLHDQTILEGRPILITCNATGNPSPNIMWTRHGDSAFKLRGSQLSLSEVYRNMSGTFTCRAENILTPSGIDKTGMFDEENVKVNVLYGPGDSIHILPSGPITVVELGSNLTISCQASCNPLCFYKWIILSTSTIEQGDSLILQNVNKSQAGIYVCKAWNYIKGLARTSNSTTKLTVRYTKQLEQIKSDTTCFSKAAGFGSAAVVLMFLSTGAGILLYKNRKVNDAKTTTGSDPIFIAGPSTISTDRTEERRSIHSLYDSIDQHFDQPGPPGETLNSSTHENSSPIKNRNSGLGNTGQNVEVINGQHINANLPGPSGAKGRNDRKRPMGKRNKHGCTYADLDLENESSDKKIVIHGLENRKEYAEVVFPKKAYPIALFKSKKADTGD